MRHGPGKRFLPAPDFRLWALQARDAGYGNLVVVDRVRRLAALVSPDVILPESAESQWAMHRQVPNLEGVVFWLPSVLRQVAVLHLSSETDADFANRMRFAAPPEAEWSRFRQWLASK